MPVTRYTFLLVVTVLTACAHVPIYCTAPKDTLTIEQRLDCLEARMTNTETTARIAVGVGVVGVATGAAALVEAGRAIHGVKEIAAGMQ